MTAMIYFVAGALAGLTVGWIIEWLFDWRTIRLGNLFSRAATAPADNSAQRDMAQNDNDDAFTSSTHGAE